MAMLFIAGIIAVGYVDAAFAHPLGNNTVNRQAGLHVTPKRLELRYLVDMAEIPTLSESLAADLDQDGHPSETEWNAYARRWAQGLLPYLRVELNRQRLPLELESQRWSLEPGSAGLSVLRLEARLSASLTDYTEIASLQYHDDHKPDELGWKEIWISAGNGVSVAQTSAAQTDRSHGLTDFSMPPGTRPLNELVAHAEMVFPSPSAERLAAQPSAPQPKRGIQPQTAQTPIKPPSVAAPRETANAQPPIRPPSVVQADARDTAINAPPLDVLLDTQPLTAVSAKAAPVSWRHQAWPFFKLGMHHIATGWDHLVFLLGLVLLRQTFLQLVKVVTAFTIAHSATLVLAANRLVVPPSSWVEPAIALSIAYVGLLGLMWRRSRHGVWLAFGFGLVHGFGFAGALAQTLAEQPSGQANWLLSLASFNLGIEAFQIFLLCMIVPPMLFAARFFWYGLAQRMASFLVLGAGLGWCFTRLMGELR